MDTSREHSTQMGTVKDTNGKDLVNDKWIKKRWKKYMEELYKKDIINWITMMVWLITQSPRHSAVWSQWALRSIAVNKASGSSEIPEELFKFLKEDSIKVLHSVCQQIWKIHQWHRTGKDESSFQFPRRVVPRNVLTIGQLHLSSMLVRSCLKSYMLGFSIMWTKNFQMSKLGSKRRTN